MADTRKTDDGLWVLDRIEDDSTAVLVSHAGTVRTVSRPLLPADVQEGDALLLREGRYVLDPEATRELRRQAEELRSSLRKGPSGPISL